MADRFRFKGLVTDYDSGLNWIRDGGLDEPRRLQGPRQETAINSDTFATRSSAVHAREEEPRAITHRVKHGQAEAEDSEHNARGRRPRRTTLLPKKKKFTDDVESDAVRLDAAHDEGHLEHGIPLKAYTPTPAVFPEEGERIPNPKYPETPPHSKSRDHSLSSSAAERDGYDVDILRAPYLSDDLSSITTDAPSISLSVENSHHEAANESCEARPGSRSQFQAQTQGRGRTTIRGGSDASIVTSAWEHESPPLHLLFLGSSLGNFDRSGSANFLRSLPLRPGSSDTLLLGLDGRNGKARVEKAYNDPDGYTAKFILNGLDVTAKALGLSGDEANLIEKFQYVGTYNEELGERPANDPFLSPPLTGWLMCGEFSTCFQAAMKRIMRRRNHSQYTQISPNLSPSNEGNWSIWNTATR